MWLRSICLTCFVLVAALLTARAEMPKSETLKRDLDAAREAGSVIAMGAIIVDANGRVLASAVSGVRKKGSDAPAALGDAWHIGSNTKMLTALTYGRMVERGEAKWGATVPELFPDLAAKMHADWSKITVEDLLAHRSGLYTNADWSWQLFGRFDPRSNSQQRTALLASAFARAPSKPGEFRYSNLGYMAVGAALDRIAARRPGAKAGDDYETLFRDVMLANADPAARSGWGFGPPLEGLEGHAPALWGGMSARGRGVLADNPAALGPAGTVHVPLIPHAILVSSFLKPDATEAYLLKPYPEAGSDYASGWGIENDPVAGRMYGHSGSNTMWLSVVTMVPDRGVVIIVNANQFDEASRTAVRAVTDGLIADMYKK